MSRARHEKEEDREERKDGGGIKPLMVNDRDSEEEKEVDEGRKHGGRAKRARGGKADEYADGGRMHGRRHDRPGRKRGGGVGSNMTPLSTAARTKDADGHSGGAGATGGPLE